MSLTRRQSRMYVHRCNIYRRGTAASAGHGFAGENTYTKIASDVPCYYQYTQNWDDPSAAGELKRANMETRDLLFMESGQEIGTGYLTYDATPGSENAGTWHMVRGAARRVGRFNEAQVPAMEIEHPPSGVTP